MPCEYFDGLGSQYLFANSENLVNTSQNDISFKNLNHHLSCISGLKILSKTNNSLGLANTGVPDNKITC